MPSVTGNGIEIAYEMLGRAEDPALLMVQGLGMPRVAWPPAFVDAVVAEGFRVVIFDNRDIGRSQLFDHLPVPSLPLQLLRRTLRLRVRAPYQLTDMMRDAVALLDGLGIESAHVVGISMGGMISQLLAIHEPRRVRSLTSIMSTTGNRRLPGPSRTVRRQMLRAPKARTDAERKAYQEKLFRLIGSQRPDYRISDAELEQFLQRNFAHGTTAAGVARQTLAILAARSRAEALANLAIPTLVIHGDSDPLVPVECGRDTAGAIPGSKLVEIAGMGHDLPAVLVPRLAAMIAGHARNAETAAGPGDGRST